MGFTEGRGVVMRPTVASWQSSSSCAGDGACRLTGSRPQDVLWVLVLGLAARGPLAPLDAYRAAQGFGATFTPTADVVAAVVEEVEASGAAVRNNGLLEITAHGRSALVRLMTAPLASLRGGLGQVEARVRLGFLDLLAAEQRGHALDRLSAAARTDLAEAAGRLDVPWAGTYGRCWAVRELAEAGATMERLNRLRAGEDA